MTTPLQWSIFSSAASASAWAYAGHDCGWVGASPAWRCKVRGEDTTVAAAVCASCADTCRASLRADQACQVRALRCAGRIEL